ncbi:citrate lyase holo-[acyl-carrier protein] synthase [Clostridium sp.]|uniref:citrate lyase holo-[acyl-carrier protein] synthase n=1 Tax=Clostridium sp. TaxID=1506 RepID=UPI002FC97E59
MDKNKIHTFNESYKIKKFNGVKKIKFNNISEIRGLIVNNIDKPFLKNQDNDETNLFVKLLEAREERVEVINKLNHKFGKTIVCLRVNYPGLRKNNRKTIIIVKELEKNLQGSFKNSLLYNFYKVTYEGPIVLFVVNEPSQKVKKDTINIEQNHPLGRLVDIDVYNESGEGISRTELNLPNRKCFLCEKEAHICVRSKAHQVEEIKKYINKTLQEFMRKEK